MNLSGTVRVSFAPTGRSLDRFQYRCKVVILCVVVYFDAEPAARVIACWRTRGVRVPRVCCECALLRGRAVL
jgi:hypothetical protein